MECARNWVNPEMLWSSIPFLFWPAGAKISVISSLPCELLILGTLRITVRFLKGHCAHSTALTKYGWKYLGLVRIGDAELRMSFAPAECTMDLFRRTN